ncbi:MAG: choice-of-anchor D domain-containing protein [Terriglobia bacterium]
MTRHGQGRETTPHGMAILAMSSHGPDARATRPHWAKARLVAALLAVVSGVACGGGGGVSTHVQTQSQPSVQVSPGSLTFGNLVVGVTSASQTVTLLNAGSATINITAVSVTGDFSQTNNCSSTVASGSNCTFLVYFTPTQTGARTGTLSITSSASSGAQTVSLSGTGVGLTAQVSPASLTFAAQLVGTASTAQNLVLANIGTTPFNFTGVNVSGDFSQTSNCPATLAAGSSCTFQVVFTPTATGTRRGILSITTTASNTLPDVNLTGTGISNSAQVSPGSLTFVNQTVGTTSVSQPVALSNSGFGVLTIASIAASANFGETNNCGGSVAANGSCTINVTFSPTASGPLTGTLTVTDNSGGVAGSTQKVSLQGTGTVATASFSALVLGFPNQAPATTSAPMTETVTNTGTVNLAISTVTIGGSNPSDFAKSADTCTGATLTPTSTCTVNVTFTPSASGSFSASVIFTDNAGGSPQTVSLTGTGIGPVATFSASALSFTNQAVNTTSAPQTETVTSSGTTSLPITGVTLSGANEADFAKSADTCTGATLTPTNTCTVSVTFTPSATGTETASLNFADNASGSPQVVTLTGNPLPGVYTQRYDNSRSGANTQEVILTPSNVNVNQFGKLFALPVDGQVYAQPLYVQNVTIPGQGVHNVVYVATQNDSVYAFDADGQSTTPLWHSSFTSATITPVPSSDTNPPGTADISPIIGITSTPVIDPVGGTLYVTAKTREPLGSNSCSSNGSYNYCYRLHALDTTTGAEKFGGPVIISASVPGTGYDNVNGTVTFLALWQLQRPGLLLLNGTVYIGFGSHGDIDPWHGWLMAYNATTLQQEAVFCTTPNLPVGGVAGTGGRGSIWQGGGGISVDSDVPPNLYIVTANGDFDVFQGGVDYGDSVLRMQLVETTPGQYQFQVLDYFSPANSAVLDEGDLDLGSSPALILPPLPGTNLNLLAMGGKDGRIWLLNRDKLGGYVTTPVPDAGAVEVIPQIGSDSLLGGMTYWNGNIYVQEASSWLNQFTLANGLMPQAPTFTSEAEFGGFPNPIPVVSANGTTNGVVWIVTIDLNTKLAALFALGAADVSGNTELYDSVQAANNRDQAGGFVKFVIPTVANGKVYIGTATEVDVYGLLP